tara:strand:- start:316 stop:1098 length:783 start_codon:yes stop_codon:yes gene_type:complete
MISYFKIFFKKNDQLKDLDSAGSNEILKQIINKNYLLKKFYIECYNLFRQELIIENRLESKILEIGSGAGFIKDIIPNTITSEIVELKDIDLKMDATKLEFLDNNIDAILLLNVLHHISNPEKFIFECQRVLKKNGIILMIEPANTWLSRIIYKNFHHEDFDEFSDWYLKEGGRLSASNQAIPSIIFERDIKKFKKKFPNLLLTKKYKFKPFHYLFSGGFSYKPMFNGYFFNLLIKLVEIILFPFNRFLGLFMFIKIIKK